MALAARQATLGGPAAIAVHNDGHMARRLDPLPTLLPGWRGRIGRGWRRWLRYFGRSRSFGHPLSPTMAARNLHRHDFFFLACKGPVDIGHDLVRRLLDLARHAGVVVLADLAVFFELLEEIERVAADVTDRDPRGFGIFVGNLDHFLAALLIEFRNAKPQHLSFGGRVQSEIGIDDRLLD